MLKKGRKQGIEKNMAVVASNCIVGQVVDVTDHFCWVMSVLHKDSKISARIKKDNQLVNVEWGGGDYRTGNVKEIPKHVRLVPGDTVVTSGNSNIFPKGILIGKISKFRENKSENFNSADLRFMIDYNKLSHVEVIIDLMQKEKAEIRRWWFGSGIIKNNINARKADHIQRSPFRLPGFASGANLG